MTTTDTAPQPSGLSADPPPIARLLVLATGLGVVAAIIATAFMLGVEEGEGLVFERLPEALGLEPATWWWATILLLVGAGFVIVAQRLPGSTGAGPLTGFHFDTPLRFVPAVILAAVGSLVFGFALGPEAPLIVLGTAVGAIVVRRGPDDARRAAMFLGGIAAIGAVFGNPFVTAFMVLELAAFGLVPSLLLVPGLVALASGYLVQIGVGRIPGVGTHSLAVPGLPAYESIAFGDLAVGAGVAIAAAVVALVAREIGLRVDGLARTHRAAAIVGAALVTGAVFALADLGVGVPIEQILFSGNSGMGGLVQETSIAAVVVIVVGKAIAYGVALGGGARGGPIFPATFLGVGVGVLAALILPFGEVTPMAAVGIAAAASAMTRLPATSALLAALLIAGTGAAIAPFAILGAVIGLLLRVALDRREGAAA